MLNPFCGHVTGLTKEEGVQVYERVLQNMLISQRRRNWCGFEHLLRGGQDQSEEECW